MVHADAHHGNPRRTNRRLWFKAHGWFALPVWGFLAFICITGTLCTVTQEISWLITPKVRAANPEGRERQSWDKLEKAAVLAHPGSTLLSIHLEQPYLADIVRLRLPDGEQKRLLVNPYSGEVQGEIDGAGLRGFMLALHGWLMLPWSDNYSIGWYLVTATSIPMLGSLVTGLVIFKRFWHLYYRPRLRFGKGSRVLWGDLHRLLAAWSLPFILLISISGLWFAVQGVLYQNEITIFPDKPMLTEQSKFYAQANQPPVRISLDRSTSLAQSQFPDFRVTYIDLPREANEPIVVHGSRGLGMLRDTAHAVYLNPYSGELVASRTSTDLSATQFISALLTPLHFGDFAGLISKMIWFFFGSLLSALVVSGFLVWNKRMFSTKTDPSNSILSTRGYLQKNRVKRWVFKCSWLILLIPVYMIFTLL